MIQGSTKSTLHPRPRLILAILFAATITLCPPTALTQTAPPQVQSTPSPTGQPQYTIRTRVPLTIVDVTVTDAKGHPVHDLKQSDFTLLEDNHEMHPNSFEEHRADQAPPPETTPLTLPPNTFTNAAPAANAAHPGPLFLLLLDELNTPEQVQQQITKRMLDFVTTLKPQTKIAVFRLTTSLSVLQGFTSDRDLLKASLTSKSNFAWPSPIGDGSADKTEEEGNHSALQGQYTLSAMRQLARYVSGMPGRKSLIWFSGSFPLKFPPVSDSVAFPPDFLPPGVDPDTVPPIPEMYDFTDEMKAATDLMAHAHLALYPIDWRGPKALQTCGKCQSGLSNSANMLFAERGTMQDMADQTGGKFFYNTNDFAGSVDEAIDAGSNFYTLTYTPANQSLDTRYRTIKVTVSQPNLKLTYRNGYYAVAPELDSKGRKIETVTPMQAAMMRGALPATQIRFLVRVTETPLSPNPSAENAHDPKQMHPPFRHFSINYSIDVHGIDFAPASDGNYRGDFEYGVRVYNADGDEIVNSTSKTVSPILLPAVYRSMLKSGANAHRDIDVPATGDYFLRIAVHDLATGHVGSIEIPTSSITPPPPGAPR
jgi:VWFA-related protein